MFSLTVAHQPHFSLLTTILLLQSFNDIMRPTLENPYFFFLYELGSIYEYHLRKSTEIHVLLTRSVKRVQMLFKQFWGCNAHSVDLTIPETDYRAELDVKFFQIILKTTSCPDIAKVSIPGVKPKLVNSKWINRFSRKGERITCKVQSFLFSFCRRRTNVRPK